jgi:hypothetical protein
VLQLLQVLDNTCHFLSFLVALPPHERKGPVLVTVVSLIALVCLWATWGPLFLVKSCPATQLAYVLWVSVPHQIPSSHPVCRLFTLLCP